MNDCKHCPFDESQNELKIKELKKGLESLDNWVCQGAELYFDMIEDLRK